VMIILDDMLRRLSRISLSEINTITTATTSDDVQHATEPPDWPSTAQLPLEYCPLPDFA
jgi:hypothetical protein